MDPASCLYSLLPPPRSMKFLWCSTVWWQHQIPALPLLVDGCCITPVHSPRDLSIYIDCDLSMQTQVQRTVSQCFTVLHQLCQICRSVLSATLQKLMVALVHSRLDYGNGVLVGLSAHLTHWLQLVLNAVAWMIYCLRTCDHITDVLISLHWLCVLERIQYKLTVLVYKVLRDDAPHYLGPLIRIDDLPERWPLCYANTNCLVVPPVKLSMIGSRAFAVAAPHSITLLRQIHCQPFLDLQCFWFRLSYPDIVC